jgi:hypothetical protein
MPSGPFSKSLKHKLLLLSRGQAHAQAAVLVS